MAQGNEKMNYKLLMILIVPAILVFVIFIYVSSNKKEETSQNVSNQIPIPEATAEEVPKSKKSAYQELKERQMKELDARGRGSEVKSDDFMALATGEVKSEDKKEPIKEQEPEVVVEKKVKRSVPKTNIIEAPKEQPKEEKVVVSEKPAEVKRGGLGVVRANSGSDYSKPKDSNNSSVSSKRFFPVLLDESITIKNNSSVVFLLLEDLNLGELLIKKNSYLFGKAKNTGVVFDIQIEEIKNTDGKLIGVREKNIYIFDEKYSKGFAHEGKLNEAVNESAGEVGSDAVGGIRTNDYTTGQALRTLDNTVGKLTKKKETTISLSKGYKVFIKME